MSEELNVQQNVESLPEKINSDNSGYRDSFDDSTSFTPIADAFEYKEPNFEGEIDLDFANAIDGLTKFNPYFPNNFSNYRNENPSMAASETDAYQQSVQQYDLTTPEGRKADFLNTTAASTNEFNTEDNTPGLDDPFYFGIKRWNADRYYMQPQFKNLGFNPLVDNEMYYGQNTGFYNNFISTGRQWMNMFGTQFIASYRSLGDIMRGDYLDPDEIGGGVMHNAMRLAGSQRGGISGWLNDFLLNSAFSFGTLVNIAIEEALITVGAGLAGVPSGGASGIPWAVRTGQNFKRGLQASHALFNMKHVYSAAANMSNILRNVDKSRDFWHATKAGAQLTGEIFTPSIMHSMRRLNTTAGTADGLSNLAKGAILFGGFYRQARQINLAFSEGKIEAGLVEIDVKDKLYRQWQKENPNKSVPSSEELKNINQHAKEAAWQTTAWNIPIIYMSNRFVFGLASRGFSNFRRAAMQAQKQSGKRLAQNVKITNKAPRPYTDVGEGFSSLWKKGIKGNVKHTLLGVGNYFQANIAEGFQELAQESLAVGITDYYTELYNTPIKYATDRMWADIGTAVNQGHEEWLAQTKKESWDKALDSHMNSHGFGVFMSGFLMGGMMQSSQQLLQSMKDLYDAKSDPDAFTYYKDLRDNIATAEAEVLNDAWQDMDVFYSLSMEDVLYQQKQQQKAWNASESEDRESYHDAEFGSLAHKMRTVLRTGKTHEFRTTFQDKLKMSDEDIKGAYPQEDPVKVRKRWEKALDNLNRYEQNYLEIIERIPDPYNPSRYKFGSTDYNREKSASKMWNFMQDMLIFTKGKFENRLQRATEVYEKMSTDPVFSKIDAQTIDILMGSEQQVNRQIGLLKMNIKNADPQTAEDKLLLRRQEEKLKHLETFAAIKFNKDNLVDGVFKKDKAKLLIKPVENYLKFLAEVESDYIIPEKINEAIVRILDHQYLNAEAGLYHDAITVLLNPSKFKQMVEEGAPALYDFWKKTTDSVNIKKRIYKDINLKWKLAFLNTIQENGLIPDEDQVVEFLESDEDNMPTIYYTADGLLTANDNPVKFKNLQIWKKKYLQGSKIQDDKNADTREDNEQYDATDRTELEKEQINEEENYQEQQDILDKEFINTDKDIQDILEREYANYEIQHAAKETTAAKIGPTKWKSTNLGKAITRARRKIVDLYNEKVSDKKKEKITIDQWLAKNYTSEYKIANLLGGVDIGGKLIPIKINQLLVNPISQESQSTNRISYDTETGVDLVKIENEGEDPYWQVLHNGENIHKIKGAVKITDPVTKQSVQLENAFSIPKAGVSAEDRAQIAYDAYIAIVKQISAATSKFKYAGEELVTGQVVYQKSDNKEYEIGSTEANIKNGQNLKLYPIEGKNRKPNKKIGVKNITETQFTDLYSTGQIEDIEYEEKKVANTGTLNLTYPFTFFPFRPSKLKPGDPFYSEKAKKEAKEKQDLLEEGQKDPELIAFDDFVKDTDFNDPEITKDITIVITPKDVKTTKRNVTKSKGKYTSELSQSPFELHMLYQGIPVGVFVFNQHKLYRPDGTEINPAELTKKEAFKLYNLKDVKDIDGAIKTIKDNYLTTQYVLNNLLNEDLEDSYSLEQFKFLIPGVTIKQNPGLLTYDSSVKFTDLDYQTVDGLHYMIFDFQIRAAIKNGKFVFDRSLRDTIHDFKDIKERKKFEDEARKQMNSENGYTTTAQLGRYVAAVKFPNGTWTFIQLQGSVKERSEVEDLFFGKFDSIKKRKEGDVSESLDGLIARQQKTIQENTTVEKVTLENGDVVDTIVAKKGNYNKSWNQSFSEQFYIEGKQGETITLGLTSSGVIQLGVLNKKYPKNIQQIYFNEKQIKTLQENYPEQWKNDKLAVLLSAMSSDFNATQKKLAQKNKNFKPYTVNLSSNSFRTNIPKTPRAQDFLEVTAMSSKEVRTHVGMQFKITDRSILDKYAAVDNTIEEVQDIIEDAEVIEETTDSDVIGKELTNKRFREWMAAPVNLFDEEPSIIENIAYKMATNGWAGLSENEKLIAHAHTDEIQKLINNDPRYEGLTVTEEVVNNTEEIPTNKSAAISQWEQLKKAHKEREVYYFDGPGRDEIIKDLISKGVIKGSVEAGVIESEELTGEISKQDSVAILKEAHKRHDQDLDNGPLSNIIKQIEQLENDIEGGVYIDKVSEDFDGYDLEDVQSAVNLAKKMVNSKYIKIKDIEDLGNRLQDRGMTWGRFITSIHNISQQIEGTMYLSPISKVVYHESFHAVFRMFLTDAEQDALLNKSKQEVRKLMRSKGGYNMGSAKNPKIAKTMEQAMEIKKQQGYKYASMSNYDLDKIVLEEYMADQLALYAERPTSKKIVGWLKETLRKIVDLVKQLIRAFNPNGTNNSNISLNSFYKSILDGKYVNSDPQDNRFSREVRAGRTLEIDKRKILLEKRAIIRTIEVDGKPKKEKVLINIYFPEEEATNMISRIMAGVNFWTKYYSSQEYLDSIQDKLEESKNIPENENLIKPTMEQIIDKAISEYIDLYYPQSNYNLYRDNAAQIAPALKMLYQKLTAAKTSITEAIRKEVILAAYDVDADTDEFTEDEFNVDQLSPSKFYESQAEKGGIMQLRNNRAVRNWIGSLTVEESDEFGNKYINPDSDSKRPLISRVNEKFVFDGLLNALSGIVYTGTTEQNIKKFLQKLYEASRTSVHTKVAVESMFDLFGLNMYTDGPQLNNNKYTIDVDKLTNKRLIVDLINVFTQHRTNDVIIQYDVNPSGGGVRMINATSSDDTAWQLKKWQADYAGKIPQDGSNAELIRKSDQEFSGKEVAMDVLSAITDLFNSEKIDEKEMFKSENEYSWNRLAYRLWMSTGISINGNTIRFSVLNGLLNDDGDVRAKDLTESQAAFIDMYPNINPLTRQDFAEIRGEIDLNANIFQNWREDKNAQEGEVSIITNDLIGVAGRLMKLARVNAHFDETVGSSVFRDSTGKLRFSYTLPNANLELGAALNDSEEISKLKNEEYVGELMILRDAKFLKMSDDKSFIVGNVVGTQSKFLQNDNGRLTAAPWMDQNQRPGTSSGNLSPLQFVTSDINQYLENWNLKSGKTNTFKFLNPITNEIEDGVSGTLILRVQSDSNIIPTLNMPIHHAVQGDGDNIELTNWSNNNILNLLELEYNSAVKETIKFQDSESTHTRYKGFNEKEGDRGFSFEKKDWLIVKPQPKDLKERILKGLGKSIRLIESGDLLKNIVEGNQTMFIRDKKWAKKTGLRVGDSGIVRLLKEDKIVEYRVRNTGLKNIADVDIDELLEGLGEHYYSLKENEDAGFKEDYFVNVGPKGSDAMYLKNQFMKKFFMGDMDMNIYEIEEIGVVKEKEDIRISIAKTWTEKTAENNPNDLYIFTENVNSLVDKSKRVGAGTAAVRGADNSIGIVTKKLYIYKEDREDKLELPEGKKRYKKEQYNQDFVNSKSDFNLFKKINTDQLNLIQDKIDQGMRAVFPKAMASSLAVLPVSFSKWLANELTTRFGIKTEVKANGKIVLIEVESKKSIEKEIKKEEKIDDTLLTELETIIQRGNEAPTFEQALEEINKKFSGKYDIVEIAKTHLMNEFTRLYSELNNIRALDFKAPLSNHITGQLIAADPNANPDFVEESMQLYNLKKDDIKYNLAQIYFWNLFQNEQANRLRFGNQLSMVPNSNAALKRAKQPTGKSAYIPIEDLEYGIEHPLTTMDVLVYQEPEIDSKYTKLTKEESAQTEESIKNKTKIDDSSFYVTTKGYRYLTYAFSELSMDQKNLIDKIENGEDITESEILGNENWKGLAKKQEILSPMKPIYKGPKDQVLLKMAQFVLIPSETSFKDTQGNYTIARPGREFYHNLRIAMEKHERDNNTIIGAGPESMSKQKTIVPVPISDIQSNDFIINDTDVMTLDTKNFRLQQDTPTNKNRITMPRQAKGTMTSEQNPNAVYLEGNKEEKIVGGVIKDYHKTIDNRSKLKYLMQRNLLFTLNEAMDEVHNSLDTGKITPELYVMLEHARAGLKSSKAKSQMLEFFEIDETTGNPKWELNNTITVKDFENYFLSFINQESFSETQSGHNGVLASSAHVPVVKEVIQVDENGFPIQWRVLREDEQLALLEKNSNWINENVKSKKQFDYDNPQGVELKPGDYYIDRLRHDMTYWKKDDKGNWYDSKQKISEIMMPAHFLNILGKLKPGEFIPEIIAKQVLIRIPTQEKQMIHGAMIVDFPASVLGSTVYAPHELIEIAGWDFDVDKVFQTIGEWYYNYQEEKHIPYGSRKGEKGFFDYIRYMVKEVARPGSLINLALSKWKSLDTSIIGERKVIKTSKEIYREWVNWINEEITMTFEGEQVGTGRKRIDVYKETDYDPDKSRLKFAANNQYYYNTTTKEFAPLLEPVIVLDRTSSDNKIKTWLDSDDSIALRGALEQAKMPITYSDYKKFIEKNNYEPYEAALNNQFLDQQFVLISNEGITKPRNNREIALGYEPATLNGLKDRYYDLLQDERTKNYFDSLGLDVYELNSIFGKLKAWIANHGVSVGRAVMPSHQIQILTELKKQIRKKNDKGKTLKYFSFNGKDYTDLSVEYITNPITNEVNPATSERKGALNSEVISAMVDNANELIAAPLGMNRDVTSTMVGLNGVGVDPIVTILFALNPNIREIYSDAYSKLDDFDPGIDRLLEDEKNKIMNWLGAQLGYATLDSKGYQWGRNEAVLKAQVINKARNENLDYDIMLDHMALGTVISQDQMNLKQKLQYLNILIQWDNARELSKFLFDMPAVTTLTNTLGGTTTEILENDLKIKNLGLNKNDKVFGKSDIIIDLRPDFNPSVTSKKSAVPYNHFLQGYYQRRNEVVKGLLPSVFISHTKPFRKLFDLMSFSKTSNVKVMDSKSKSQLELDILSFLQTLAYQHRLKNFDPNLLLSLNNGFIYDNINSPIKVIDVYDRIKKYLSKANSDGTKKNNLLIDQYLFKNKTTNLTNNSGTNQLVFNTATYLGPDIITRLKNSLLDLYTDPIVHNDVKHLINYLIVKDGLQYTRNSFLQVIDLVMLEDILRADSKVVNVLRKVRPNDTDFMGVFGMTQQQIANKLIQVLSIKNSTKRQLPVIRGVDEYDDIANMVIEKPINKDLAAEMISKNDTHIYIISDNINKERKEEFDFVSGVQNVFSIPTRVDKDTPFNDDSFKSSKEKIDKAIENIIQQSKYGDGKTLVWSYTPGQNALMSLDQWEEMYNDARKTAIYLRDEISEKLGFDISKGKESYSRMQKLERSPAVISGNKLYIDKYGAMGVSRNIEEGSENMKMLPRRINLDRLFKRDRSGLVFRKEFKESNKFFKRNSYVFEDVQTEMGVGKQADLNLSLTKFKPFVAVSFKEAYTNKVTYKFFILERIWTDPDTSLEMRKKGAKGYDRFFNIEKDDFLEDAFLGTAAEYVEVELEFSNSQTNIAALLPGNKLFNDILAERKIKQDLWTEQEENDFGREEDDIAFLEEEVTNRNVEYSGEETKTQGTEEDDLSFLDGVEESSTNEVVNQQKYSTLAKWQEENKDVLKENKISDIVESYKKVLIHLPKMSQEEYIEQIKKKCK